MKPYISYTDSTRSGKHHSSSMIEKIGYGLGDMSSSMYWKIFSYYLPLFFSDVYGLSLASTGLLILITRIWDAVSDPVIGIIVDRTNSRHGKYRSYLLWFAIPFAIAGCLLFNTPAWDETGKLVWAYVTYILMTTVYSFINVPYAAMLSVITTDSAERTVFASYRMFFAYVGSFFAMFAWEPLCDFFASGDDIRSIINGWTYGIIAIGIIGIWMFIASYMLTQEHIQIRSTSSVFEDVKSLLSNRPWQLMTFVSFCSNLFNACRGTAAAYYFKYYIGEATNIDIGFTGFLFFSGLFMAVGEACSMAGTLFAPTLSARFGKRYTFMCSSIMMSLMSVSFFYLPLTNFGFIATLILQIIISVIAGLISPIVWSMYSDVSDYSIAKKGIASIGLIFSTGSMSQKIGGAVAGAFVIWMIGAMGFVPNSDMQTDTAILGIKMSMTYIPAAIALLMALALWLCPKDKEMLEINNQIKNEIETN